MGRGTRSADDLLRDYRAGIRYAKVDDRGDGRTLEFATGELSAFHASDRKAGRRPLRATTRGLEKQYPAALFVFLRVSGAAGRGAFDPVLAGLFKYAHALGASRNCRPQHMASCDGRRGAFRSA